MNEERLKPVSIGSWIVTFILSIIPFVNIVYWIIILFGGGNKSKVNLARAVLVLCLISFGLMVLLIFVLGGGLDNIAAKLSELLSELQTKLGELNSSSLPNTISLF